MNNPNTYKPNSQPQIKETKQTHITIWPKPNKKKIYNEQPYNSSLEPQKVDKLLPYQSTNNAKSEIKHSKFSLSLSLSNIFFSKQ